MTPVQKDDSKLSEILGVVLLGLAALAAAAVYFDAVGMLGVSMRSLIFGMGGTTGYYCQCFWVCVECA